MADISDDDIRDSIGAFEAAVASKRVDIPPVQPKRLLLAVDGSNQDDTVESVAAAIARRSGMDVRITFAYEGDADAASESYLRERATRLSAQGINVEPVRVGEGRPFRQILDLCERERCDLIVVCAPYLEDFRELGTASVGTNLDMLLNRRGTPLLVIREPAADVSAQFKSMLLPLNLLSENDTLCVAWSFHLLGDQGTLNLLGVADTEAIDATRQLAGETLNVNDLDERTLAGLGRPEMAGLIAAVQRKASERNVGCRVTVRLGTLVQAVTEFANREPAILVTGCPQDCSQTGYLRVQALIRASRNPVLVV